MSQLSTKKIKLGDNADTSKNFIISVPAVADGTLTIERESGIDVLTMDASGKITLPITPTVPYSSVYVITPNAYGSTNTRVLRFTTVLTNQGTDITYADSATLGSSFTINTSGVYSVHFRMAFATAANNFGVSLNSTQLTTSIAVITAADVIAMSIISSVDFTQTCSNTLYLPAGSVIRPHVGEAYASGSNPTHYGFTITRVA